MYFTRGGDTHFGYGSVPLVCYVLCRPRREFTSNYTHESARTVVNWVYDLHVFMSAKAKEPASAGVPLLLPSLDPPPYRYVREFASNWWKNNGQAFVQVKPMHQSAWIYEAILDGINVWYEYKKLDGAVSASDTVEFGNAVGKDRQYNRRFLQMCSHHLVEPVACTPAAGWEKGQVENQVGLVRERFFAPRLRFETYDDLNGWLVDKCLVWARAHAHPEQSDKTIWEAFEAERPKLVPYRGRFDGFHALPASVSKTCLVRFDNNRYSVNASAVGRPVDIHAYADRIVVRQDGRVVAEHPRKFGRGHTIYNPWHYVPILARKPGALRNGAPCRDWVLPAALERLRRKLAGSDDGDRQMVKILAAVLTDGLPAIEAACAQALAENVVLNILARRRDPEPPPAIHTPAALSLRHAPVADCARYDTLRSA